MTLCIAHRGYGPELRENTISAFLSAVSIGADMVECDVRVTKDGRAVILHDRTLERLWNVPFALADLTWEQVRQLTAGAESLPTLDEVLSKVPIPIMLDFADPKAAPLIADALAEQKAWSRAVVVSGAENILAFRDLAEDARVGLTWDDGCEPSVALLERLRPEFFNPMWSLLLPEFSDTWRAAAMQEDHPLRAVMAEYYGEVPKTSPYASPTPMRGKETVADIHARGIRVSVWTVDEEPAVNAMLAAGVDAIISNDSAMLLRVLGRGRDAKMKMATGLTVADSNGPRGGDGKR
ncbi:MAG: glycerophosphodiester phosphodiesterase family protein [Alicyclobacillaceae bacterium]|nr:glycerophosphodiester phosphodiesterase family protein [Alicyclobacillaceae bacterium]